MEIDMGSTLIPLPQYKSDQCTTEYAGGFHYQVFLVFVENTSIGSV
jgi:hypothetical protein